jgi:hypothetical protein
MNKECSDRRLVSISDNSACYFIFPCASLLQRPIERNGSGMQAVNDAAATIPALIGVQDDWGAALIGAWDKHVHLANIHTRVTPLAKIGIKNHGRVRSCDVG